MLATAEEQQINLKMIFYGQLHMDTPVLINKQKLTFISSVQTLNTI